MDELETRAVWDIDDLEIRQDGRRISGSFVTVARRSAQTGAGSVKNGSANALSHTPLTARAGLRNSTCWWAMTSTSLWQVGEQARWK